MTLLNKFQLFLLLTLTVAVFASCSTTTIKTTTASEGASLKPEPMKIWSRPLEIGFKVVGVAEGSATSNDNKRAIKSMPNFFLSGSIPISNLSPVAKLAAYNVMKKNKADGIFITMVHEKNVPDEGKTALVRGVLLKIVIYDTVSSERSDTERNLENKCLEKFLKKSGINIR